MSLEQFVGFETGDLFFFTDLASGAFSTLEDDETGIRHRLYSEVALRVSPYRIIGKRPQKLAERILVAGQINRGSDGFSAYMLGAGIDLSLPGFTVFSFNAYYRKDNYNEGTYQTTIVWDAPFSISGLSGTFQGFGDFYGTDDDGVDIHTQPQLLFNLAEATVQVGIELIYHRNKALSVVSPQALVKVLF